MTLQEAEVALAALGPRPFPLPLGRLAPVVEGGFTGMSKRNWVVAGPRERIGAILRGCPVERLVDPATGARPYKLAPVSNAPGNRALHAVGLALGTGEPVLCFLGLASAASGALHEALNAAVLTGAPVIFLLTVHPITDDAPISGQLAANPSALAAAHGLQTVQVTADTESVRQAVSDAAASARPTLIEAILE